MVFKKLLQRIKPKKKIEKQISDPKFKEWPFFWLSKYEESHGFKKYGYRFIQNFKHSFYKGRKYVFLCDLTHSANEGPLAVGLLTSRSQHFGQIGLVTISFKKNEVVVDAIQSIKGASSELHEFEQIVGMPWANYLIIEIEKQARENGYHCVKIITPENQQYFGNPSVSKKVEKKRLALSLSGKGDEANALMNFELEKIRERMRRLYNNTAKTLNYKRQGQWWVKKL